MEHNLWLAAHHFSFWYWKLGGTVKKKHPVYANAREKVKFAIIFRWKLCSYSSVSMRYVLRLKMVLFCWMNFSFLSIRKTSTKWWYNMWRSVHSWKDQSQRITSFMCGWLAVRMKRLSKSNFEEHPLISILLFYSVICQQIAMEMMTSIPDFGGSADVFYNCAAWLSSALIALMFAEARNRNGLRLISPERGRAR